MRFREALPSHLGRNLVHEPRRLGRRIGHGRFLSTAPRCHFARRGRCQDACERRFVDRPHTLPKVETSAVGWDLPKRLEVAVVELERERLSEQLEVGYGANQPPLDGARTYLSHNADAEVDLRLKAPTRTPSSSVVDERLSRADKVAVPGRILVRHTELIGVRVTGLRCFVLGEYEGHADTYNRGHRDSRHVI
jgi:hypothetical protein